MHVANETVDLVETGGEETERARMAMSAKELSIRYTLAYMTEDRN